MTPTGPTQLQRANKALEAERQKRLQAEARIVQLEAEVARLKADLEAIYRAENGGG